MQAETSALRGRWTPELIQQAAKALQQQAVFTPFPPLTLNGTQYQDLRGLTILEPVRNPVFDHLDFTSARFDYNGQFADVTAKDCLFIGATLDTNLSGTFRRCRFDGAVLGGATIYPWSTFSQCTFVKTDLKSTKGTALTFDRCNFRAANLRGARFSESEFYLCAWDDVQFAHTSLGRSKITRDGFPADRGIQDPTRVLPDVMLDGVEWLNSPALDSWAREFEDLMEARAASQRRKVQEQLLQDGRAAYKAKRFEQAIARFSEAAGLGPLDAVSEKMLGMARKQFE